MMLLIIAKCRIFMALYKTNRIFELTIRKANARYPPREKETNRFNSKIKKAITHNALRNRLLVKSFLCNIRKEDKMKGKNAINTVTH